MNISKAASNTLLLWTKNCKEKLPEPKRTKLGIELCHQHWLLLEVFNEKVLGEKAHRWLSWAQGVLAANGVLSLEDCKYANVLTD